MYPNLSRQYARQYASQLLFEVRPSRTHKAIILVVSVISLFSAALLSIEQLSTVMLNTGFLLINLFVVLVLVYFTISELKNNRLRQLHWREDGCWLIYDGALESEVPDIELSPGGFKSNRRVWAELLPGSVITPYFALLNFKSARPVEFQKTSTISLVDFYSYFSRWIKPENSKYLSVLLFKDNIEEEKFRQLRVRLKVEGIAKQARGAL